MSPSEVIKKEEGYVDYVYLCPAGHQTIGYGFNVDKDAGGILPKQVADYWLERELAWRTSDLMNGIFGPRWVLYLPARQAALISMHYQLGADGFRQFKKMIQCVKSGDWHGASRECVESKAGRSKTTGPRFKRNADALRTGKDQWQ